MIKELIDIDKLKMKILKMMLKSIDIQIRMTYFYRKEKEFISSMDAIYFYCVQISKITRENFQIMHCKYFISSDEQKNRDSKRLIVEIPRRLNFSSIDDEISKIVNSFFYSYHHQFKVVGFVFGGKLRKDLLLGPRDADDYHIF